MLTLSRNVDNCKPLQFGTLLEGIGFIPSGARSVDSASAPHNTHAVGRCKLTVSKPMSKAPLVSALETII